MNKQEAIKILMNHTQHFVPNNDLDALYMAVESLEKEVSKKPIEIKVDNEREWMCPICDSRVGDIVNVDNYCRNCGQKILFNKNGDV